MANPNTYSARFTGVTDHAGGTPLHLRVVDSVADLPTDSNINYGDIAFVISGGLIYRRNINTNGWTLIFDPVAELATEVDLADLAGFQAQVEGFLADELAGKAAASHTHAQADITSLVSDLAGKAPTVHTHAAADVTSGTLATARLGSGTADSTTVLHGNSTWAAVTSVGTITTGVWNGTDIAVADGGTGASTAVAAFDNLAPTTTQGDFIYHNGTDNVRLAKGTASQHLKMNSGATAPEWGSAQSGLFFGAGSSSGHSPADATTYYLSTSYSFNPTTADATAGISMFTCRITGALVTVTVLGTLGTTETAEFFVRKNSTTEASIGTIQFSAATQTLTNTALNFSLTNGDRFYIKFVCPTWVTNPTAVFYGVTFIVETP